MAYILLIIMFFLINLSLKIIMIPIIIRQHGINNLSIVLSLIILNSVSKNDTPIRRNSELEMRIPFENILAILGRIKSNGQKSNISILIEVNAFKI